jgi:ABC-type xylose transport system permease subunit
MGVVMRISGDSPKWYEISGDYRDSKWFAIGFFTIAPVTAGLTVAADSSESGTVRWAGGFVAVVAFVALVFFHLRSERRKRKHRRRKRGLL